MQGMEKMMMNYNLAIDLAMKVKNNLKSFYILVTCLNNV